MPRRIAATFSLIIFAVTLVTGAYQAGNSFSTAVLRAILAMVATYVIGLVLGTMAQRMLDENIRQTEEKIKNSEGNATPSGR